MYDTGCSHLQPSFFTRFFVRFFTRLFTRSITERLFTRIYDKRHKYFVIIVPAWRDLSLSYGKDPNA
jgi:hypothetical protein